MGYRVLCVSNVQACSFLFTTGAPEPGAPVAPPVTSVRVCVLAGGGAPHPSCVDGATRLRSTTLRVCASAAAAGEPSRAAAPPASLLELSQEGPRDGEGDPSPTFFWARLSKLPPDLQPCPLQGPPGKSRTADLQGSVLLTNQACEERRDLPGALALECLQPHGRCCGLGCGAAQ